MKILRTMKRITIIGWVSLLLLYVAGITPLSAQDDYNPGSPPEPYIYYSVTVNSDPTGMSVSGGGKYLEGKSVTITAVDSANYHKFTHWNRDGEFWGTERTFSYTVENVHTTFTACYEEVYHEEDNDGDNGNSGDNTGDGKEEEDIFNPTNPAEPTVPSTPSTPSAPVTRTLTLVSSPAGKCTFNVSTVQQIEVQDYIYLRAYPATNYKFVGWYSNGVRISTSAAFNYQMPEHNVTLTAICRYDYDPTNPSEPGNTGQENVDLGQMGDANGDGLINVADAVHLINVYLAGGVVAGNNIVCDMNDDGKIDVADAVMIVNNYLNNE